ncbi:MAG: hypothetical protein LBU32_04995 [Clostridiales bacterium]|nr:hypothetical protein [Clostridiales bacterium]
MGNRLGRRKEIRQGRNSGDSRENGAQPDRCGARRARRRRRGTPQSAPSISTIPTPASRRGRTSAATGFRAASRKKGESRTACPHSCSPRRRTGAITFSGKYWVAGLRRKCSREILIIAQGAARRKGRCLRLHQLQRLPQEKHHWEGAYLAPGIHSPGKGKYAVKTVSLTQEPVHSIGEFTALPDYDTQSAPKDFAGLVLIGGNTWRDESAKGVMPLVRLSHFGAS